MGENFSYECDLVRTKPRSLITISVSVQEFTDARLPDIHANASTGRDIGSSALDNTESQIDVYTL